MKSFLYLGEWIDRGDKDPIPYTIIVHADDQDQAEVLLRALVDEEAYKVLTFTLTVTSG